MERTSPTRYGIEVPRLKWVDINRMRGEVMEKITTVGLDLAKQLMRVHAVDAAGRVVMRKVLRRDAAVALVGRTAAVRGGDGGMRRCASLGAGADAARAYGADHRGGVRAGRFARAAKNDANDAEAICYRGAATEHALRGDEVGGATGGAVRAPAAPGPGRGAHGS